MKVEPYRKTTLVLNSIYAPIGFFTARNTIRHMMRFSGKGMDRDFNALQWDDWNHSLNMHDDQPYMSSAHHDWYIPTILLIPSYSKMPQFKKNTQPTRKQLYVLYDAVCQYCLKKIPFDQATKDHAYPKCKGGSNDDFNLVLACKRCNRDKGHKYPFMNALGKEVRARTLVDLNFRLQRLGIDCRDEWEHFMFN